MASIRQRGPDRWQLRTDHPQRPPGTPRVQCQKTIHVTDPDLLRSKRRLAQYLREQLALYQLELANGPPPGTATEAEAEAPPPLTVADFAQRWVREHIAMNLAVNSQQNYGHYLDRWIVPHLGHLAMVDVQPHHLTELLAHMRSPGAGRRKHTLGDASVLYCYRVLRSLFATAKGWQVIASNPMAGITKPREQQRPDVSFYEEHELEQLGAALDQASPELRAVILLGVAAGLRRGEIAALQWRHIDFATRTLSVRQSLPKYTAGHPHIKGPKTAAGRRRIAMPALLADALLQHQATQAASMYRPGAENRAPEGWAGPDDWVFCHPSGRPVDPQRLTKWWIAFHRRHGLRPIRLHDLRHTAAAWLIRRNQHPKTVAGMLGHAQIKTSMDVYGHLMASLFPQTAAAMDTMPLRKNNSTPPPAGVTV